MSAHLYKTDFYTWTKRQAELLRAGRLGELDTGNLIAEIESMGRSERRELRSRMTVLLMHLLKWRYQREWQCNSWRSTISQQRRRFLDVLDDNPGLRPEIPDLLEIAYSRVRCDAAEETGIFLENFPEACPFTYEQIIDSAFWPSR